MARVALSRERHRVAPCRERWRACALRHTFFGRDSASSSSLPWRLPRRPPTRPTWRDAGFVTPSRARTPFRRYSRRCRWRDRDSRPTSSVCPPSLAESTRGEGGPANDKRTDPDQPSHRAHVAPYGVTGGCARLTRPSLAEGHSSRRHMCPVESNSRATPAASQRPIPPGLPGWRSRAAAAPLQRKNLQSARPIQEGKGPPRSPMSSPFVALPHPTDVALLLL